MTGVYSGGLVYEYSMEDNKFGMVKIDGNNVEELNDYKALKSAFSGTKSPSGDGGYKSSGSPSECPTKSSTWDVDLDANSLPKQPDGVADFFKKGAGTGPGLKGAGSQDSGAEETTLATATAGSVASGAASASASKGAASAVYKPESLMAPLVCGLVVVVSSLFGASLI